MSERRWRLELRIPPSWRRNLLLKLFSLALALLLFYGIRATRRAPRPAAAITPAAAGLPSVGRPRHP